MGICGGIKVEFYSLQMCLKVFQDERRDNKMLRKRYKSIVIETVKEMK